MSDPEFYRKKEEIDRWRALDPIEQLKRRLLADGVITEDVVAKIQQEVDTMATEAADFAEQSAFPPADSLMRDIYADGPARADGRGTEVPHA
jgi:pyruvate dehydrogenase E1 component alpha subunit